MYRPIETDSEWQDWRNANPELTSWRTVDGVRDDSDPHFPRTKTMDPNSAIALILTLVANDDISAAVEIAGGLLEWIDRGGFPPDELTSAAADVESARDDFFPSGATGDDSDYIEFRLFIRPEGDIELATGSPDYDTDHRGFCGAGSVTADDSAADILAAVLAAFDDCVETMAQFI
jgi:hypothetical protein